MKRLVVVLAACSSAPVTSSTEQATTIVFPAVHDFGSVQAHTTSAAAAFTISPSIGENDDVITAITAPCTDFSVQADALPFEVFRTCTVIGCTGACGEVVAPPTSCQTDTYQDYTFTTTFHPNVAGPLNCMVTIEFSTQPSRTINLTGTGVAPPIDIDVTPAAINFGDVRRATTSTQVPLAVQNLGGSALHVSAVAISSGFAIASGPPGPFDVPPGGAQPYALVCMPTGLGPLAGSFVVTSDDPATPSVTVPLACNGIDSSLAIAPSPAVLAPTRVGEPVELAIAITNSGAAPSNVESIAVTGDMLLVSGLPANTLLAPSASVQVTVAFPATTNGDAAGSLAVAYDGGQIRTVQLAGRALATSMSLAPGDVELGPICAGQTATQTFTILANDEGAFEITDIAIPAAPFTLAAPALPAHVEGGGAKAVTFTVTAAPTGAGDFSSEIAIATDIPNGQTRAVEISATSLGAGVTATPATLDLGSQQLGEHQLGRELDLTNCAGAEIRLANAYLTGANADEFAIVAEPEGDALAPGHTAAWLVVLATHTVGLKHAQFSVDYDGGTATIDLDGEALGATAPALDLHSYYACSAGGPAQAWPALLALAYISRRRRARLGR